MQEVAFNIKLSALLMSDTEFEIDIGAMKEIDLEQASAIKRPRKSKENDYDYTDPFIEPFEGDVTAVLLECKMEDFFVYSGLLPSTAKRALRSYQNQLDKAKAKDNESNSVPGQIEEVKEIVQEKKFDLWAGLEGIDLSKEGTQAKKRKAKKKPETVKGNGTEQNVEPEGNQIPGTEVQEIKTKKKYKKKEGLKGCEVPDSARSGEAANIAKQNEAENASETCKPELSLASAVKKKPSQRKSPDQNEPNRKIQNSEKLETQPLKIDDASGQTLSSQNNSQTESGTVNVTHTEASAPTAMRDFNDDQGLLIAPICQSDLPESGPSKSKSDTIQNLIVKEKLGQPFSESKKVIDNQIDGLCINPCPSTPARLSAQKMKIEEGLLEFIKRRIIDRLKLINFPATRDVGKVKRDFFLLLWIIKEADPYFYDEYIGQAGHIDLFEAEQYQGVKKNGRAIKSKTHKDSQPSQTDTAGVSGSLTQHPSKTTCRPAVVAHGTPILNECVKDEAVNDILKADDNITKLLNDQIKDYRLYKGTFTQFLGFNQDSFLNNCIEHIICVLKIDRIMNNGFVFKRDMKAAVMSIISMFQTSVKNANKLTYHLKEKLNSIHISG